MLPENIYGSFLGGWPGAGTTTPEIHPNIIKKYNYGITEWGGFQVEGFKEENGIVLVATNQLCKLLDITDKSLTNWKRQGLKQHSRGWWDLQHVLKWRGVIQSSIGQTDTKAVNLQQKKIEAEVAFKEAQAELARIKTDIAEGKYIEKDIVETELARFFLVFKKSAMAIPRKLAGSVAGFMEPIEARRIEKDLSDMVNDALDQMSVDGVYSAKKKRK